MTRFLLGLLGLSLLILSTSCAPAPNPEILPSPTKNSVMPTPFVIDRAALGLPTTATPQLAPSPTNTRVLQGTWTPTVVPSATPMPPEVRGLVTRIVDTETLGVVLEGDPLNLIYRVRLLGIDGPNNSPTDPWGEVAFTTLQRWLEGQVVFLVADETLIEAGGELPRYVYWDDTLINQRLLALGLARLRPETTNQTLTAELAAAAEEAESQQLGLWGPLPTPTTTPQPRRSPTLTRTLTPTASLNITSTATTTLTPNPSLSPTLSITATATLTSP